jgi:hypothetical protein
MPGSEYQKCSCRNLSRSDLSTLLEYVISNIHMIRYTHDRYIHLLEMPMVKSIQYSLYT